MKFNEILIEMPIILFYILQISWNKGYNSNIIIKSYYLHYIYFHSFILKHLNKIV
jgi:hypothetical protein